MISTSLLAISLLTIPDIDGSQKLRGVCLTFSRPRLSGSLWYQKQIHNISDSRAKFKLTERFNPEKRGS